MTTPIYRLSPDARLAKVESIVYGDGELNETDGRSWTLSIPAVVVYEQTRGVSDPVTRRVRVVGLAFDTARLAYGLVVVGDNGRLYSIPLTTLVSISRAES
jgi:hypothetical protein